MTGFFRKLFRNRNGKHESAADRLSPSLRISQQHIDTEATKAWLMPEFGLIPPFDLNEYLSLYLSDSLAKTLIDGDTWLTVSDLVCESESDELCKFINEFHQKIDIDSVVYRAVLDCNLYGYHVSEIVGNGSTLQTSTEILAIKRIDPRFIILQKDRQGRLQAFIQRPGFNNTLSTFPVIERRLDPDSIIYISNWSPFTSYGHSLLQSIKTRLADRNEIIAAAVMASINHANPVLHLKYQESELKPESKEEADAKIAEMQKVTAEIDANKSRWLYSIGRGSYAADPVGHSSLPDVTKLLEHLTADIIISAGANPASLGFNFGSGNVATNEASQKTILNNIITKQNEVVCGLKKLYDILPFVERATPAGDIKVKMQPPTSETLDQKYSALAKQINNVILLWRHGVISPDAGARELGYDSINDKDKWEAALNSNDEMQGNDPNELQDQRAGIASLNKGKTPSNNPSGQRGDT